MSEENFNEAVGQARVGATPMRVADERAIIWAQNEIAQLRADNRELHERVNKSIKPHKADPLAYCIFAENGNVRIWWANDNGAVKLSAMKWSEENNTPLIALYASPVAISKTEKTTKCELIGYIDLPNRDHLRHGINATINPTSEGMRSRMPVFIGQQSPRFYGYNFGHGALVVQTGKYGGTPCVFIRPARCAGEVGEKIPEGEEADKNHLEEHETVLTFPTSSQAAAVAGALTLAPRITEQDARAIVRSLWVYLRGQVTPKIGAMLSEDKWFDLQGRDLLNKLNAEIK